MRPSIDLASLPVSHGLKTTLELLSTSENAAAARAIIPALDSPREAIRDGALLAILSRRDPAGHREVLRRFDRFDERRKAIVRERGGSMTQALREAVSSPDEPICRTACELILWLREHNLIPALVGAMTDRDALHGELLGVTLIALVENLRVALAGPSNASLRRDPELFRGHIVGVLESSLAQFRIHERREVVEAFLLLATPDNMTLGQILDDPYHAAFVATMDLLFKSDRPCILDLLLNCLDDPFAPRAALSVIGRRHDARLVSLLLEKIARGPSDVMARNLKRIETIGWLDQPEMVLDALDDVGQCAAVQFVMASGVSRLRTQGVVEYLLTQGKPGGRRAASKALAEFSGARANLLALHALDDHDPTVQVNIIRQLRGRGIPGVLARLTGLADSPHDAVRQAMSDSFDEFSFERYLGVFETLDEDSRREIGLLAKKSDARAISLLKKDLGSKLRTQRLRALRAIGELGVVDELESLVAERLNDEDHLVRLEAVSVLAESVSSTARAALLRVVDDRSRIVADAAREALRSWQESGDSPWQLTTSWGEGL